MCRLLKGLYSYFIRINDIDCCLGEAHGSVFFQRDFPCWTLCRVPKPAEVNTSCSWMDLPTRLASKLEIPGIFCQDLIRIIVQI